MNDLITYNVYGYVYCENKIVLVKNILTRAFNISNENITFKEGILNVNIPIFEMKITKKDNKRWSIEAAFSQDVKTNIQLINMLKEQLNWYDINSSFEMYDDEFKCIYSINAD